MADLKGLINRADQKDQPKSRIGLWSSREWTVPLRAKSETMEAPR
jgi:hypothetical protein